MLIVQPTTPYFKLRYEKAGVVAPGMAQKICIDFFPDECRYYYDCIRIRAEGDNEIEESDSSNNLLIPIHGYPVINNVIFPSRVDFGDCFVSESVTKNFNIECKVPIQFEYELTLIRPNPNFKITPLTGIIPPHGKAPIQITFQPGMYGTFDCEILVNVSQFNFEPFKCIIVGSSSPGKHRQRELEVAASHINQNISVNLAAPPDSFPGAPLAPLTISSALGHTVGTNQVSKGGKMTASMLETYDRGVPAAAPRGKGSGAACDAGAEWYTENMRKVKLPTREDPGPAPPLPETIVEGLRFPGDMRGNFNVNYVLTQTVGKLKPKDLKEAIRQQRDFRAKQKQEQEEARARTAGGGGTEGGNRPEAAGKYSVAVVLAVEMNTEDSRQIKEMAFLQDISDLDREEKEREFKSSVTFIGEPLMTKNHVTMIEEARQRAETDMVRKERQELRMQSEDIFRGPYEIPSKYGRASTQVGASDFLRKSCEPTFDIYKNDLWRKRRKQLARLVYLVGQWITRRRVDRRIGAVNRKIKGMSKKEVREMIELEYQQAANAGGSASKKNEKKMSKAEEEEIREKDRLEGIEVDPEEEKMRKVLEKPYVVKESLVIRESVPMYEEDASIERMPLDIQDRPLGFQDLPLGSLKMGIESVEHGYTEIDPPAISMYVPIETTKTLRTGAEEESGLRGERDGSITGWDGLVVDDAKSPESPRKEDNIESSATFLDEITDKSFGLELSGPCLPESMTVYNPPENLNLLRYDNTVRVYAPVTSMLVETDVDWNLRPRPIEREVPASIGRSYSLEVGSSTLHSYRNVKTISSSWRPRRERRGGALSCLAVGTRQSLFGVKDMPTYQSCQAEEDDMSDSESDDENAAADRPTPAEARCFFEKMAGTYVEGASDEENDNKNGDGNADGEKQDDEVAGQQVMRDRKMLDLERRKREVRTHLASRLPDRMKNIQAEMLNLKHSMLLMKPFHRLEVQYPEFGEGSDEKGPL